MSQQVIPINFTVLEIGKHVKSSKKRYTWQLYIKGKNHLIVLQFSFISGKIKLVVDRKVLLENQLPPNVSFQYPFSLNGSAINVLQQGENFELRVNNKVFEHLYNQKKTKNQFKTYEEEIKNVHINQGAFNKSSAKVKLNIGGFSKNKKKVTQNQNQIHDWNAFGQNDNNFPNYFQNKQIKIINKKNQKKQNINIHSKISQQIQNNIPIKQIYDNIIDFDCEPKQKQKLSQILYSPNQQHIDNLLKQNPIIVSNSNNQFNTMQNLFDTMNLNSEITTNKVLNIQSKEQSKIDDFFNLDNNKINTQQKSQSSNNNITHSQEKQIAQQLSQQFTKQPQQEINLNDFNTMQNLFNTNTNFDLPKQQPQTLQQSIPQVQTEKNKNFFMQFSNQSNSISNQIPNQMKTISGQSNLPYFNNNTTSNYGTLQLNFNQPSNNLNLQANQFNLNTKIQPMINAQTTTTLEKQNSIDLI